MCEGLLRDQVRGEPKQVVRLPGFYGIGQLVREPTLNSPSEVALGSMPLTEDPRGQASRTAQIGGGCAIARKSRKWNTSRNFPLSNSKPASTAFPFGLCAVARHLRGKSRAQRRGAQTPTLPGDILFDPRRRGRCFPGQICPQSMIPSAIHHLHIASCRAGRVRDWDT